MRVSMFTALEERRESNGRFLGVTKTVIVKAEEPPLRRARRRVKSKRGIMWPCSGNGNIKTCVFVVGVLFPSLTVILLIFLFSRKFWLIFFFFAEMLMDKEKDRD